jgi:hypothetical protein
MWVLLLLVASSSCTFERRVELDPDGSSEEEAPQTPGVEVRMGDPGAAAVDAVRLFRESVELGDLSLALALLDREATVVDELVGEAREAATRGELLLELRRRHAAGLSFEPLEAPTTIALAEAALVVSRLTLVQEDEDGARVEAGRVSETVFLTASADGWRIRHLHRSLAP